MSQSWVVQHFTGFSVGVTESLSELHFFIISYIALLSYES